MRILVDFTYRKQINSLPFKIITAKYPCILINDQTYFIKYQMMNKFPDKEWFTNKIFFEHPDTETIGITTFPGAPFTTSTTDFLFRYCEIPEDIYNKLISNNITEIDGEINI